MRRSYRDFGPTLATEALEERHGIKVGRSTVRKWMVADGLWCRASICIVEVYNFIDKPLEIRWKGNLLPYRVFRKDQRVTQAAVVENKRLGHALAIVKAQQDQKLEAKVLINSEKTGYKKRPRHLYGPDFVVEKPAPAAAEIWNRQRTASTHIPTARRRRLYHITSLVQLQRTNLPTRPATGLHDGPDVTA